MPRHGAERAPALSEPRSCRSRSAAASISPMAWSDIPGWNDDDQLAAYKTFRASCKPIAAQHDAPPDPMRQGARRFAARALPRGPRGRYFRRRQGAGLFRGAISCRCEISRLGQDAGFVTGYYEPIIDGSRTQTDVYNVPVYRRPSNLFMRGYSQASPGLPNKGQVFRKIGRRKLVPYYDRGRDRGRRDRRPRPRNLLAEGPDRSAVRADPGLGAGPPARRLDAAHQLRFA